MTKLSDRLGALISDAATVAAADKVTGLLPTLQWAHKQAQLVEDANDAYQKSQGEIREYLRTVTKLFAPNDVVPTLDMAKQTIERLFDDAEDKLKKYERVPHLPLPERIPYALKTLLGRPW